MTKDEFLEGQVLLIDKPLGWTSFQAVNKIKWAIKRKFSLKKIKIGHAGTLDPLATGLLLICTGKFTKNIEQLQGAEKEYTGTITLGATTPSYDLETEVDATYPINHITKRNQSPLPLPLFLGKLSKEPPIYSALKKDGKRLYEYAREGQDVTIKKRKVSITDFEITQVNLPDIQFRISCGKGTYIRSLAHDFGIALRSGGHLSALRRTKIGDYNVNKAMDPNAFADILLQNNNIP